MLIWTVVTVDCIKVDYVVYILTHLPPKLVFQECTRRVSNRTRKRVLGISNRVSTRLVRQVTQTASGLPKKSLEERKVENSKSFTLQVCIAAACDGLNKCL